MSTPQMCAGQRRRAARALPRRPRGAQVRARQEEDDDGLPERREVGLLRGRQTEDRRDHRGAAPASRPGSLTAAESRRPRRPRARRQVPPASIRLSTTTDMATGEVVDTAFVDNFVESDAVLYFRRSIFSFLFFHSPPSLGSSRPECPTPLETSRHNIWCGATARPAQVHDPEEGRLRVVGGADRRPPRAPRRARRPRRPERRISTSPRRHRSRARELRPPRARSPTG